MQRKYNKNARLENGEQTLISLSIIAFIICIDMEHKLCLAMPQLRQLFLNKFSPD